MTLPHVRLAAIIAAALITSACAGRATASDSPVANDQFGTLNGAAVELASSGGFAALATVYHAAHDDRSYTYARRHICSTDCGAPLDSTSGTLAPNVVDSLFSIVVAASPELKPEYGTTAGGADMLDYSLRVTIEGRTKTVHADDGTMPDAMRRIVDAIRGIVAAARK